ncbi:MAG: hypothetical protein K8E24_014335 [Methanobacterium paludis]|nr:hypothetical protein [Methanobacterium paludis]
MFNVPTSRYGAILNWFKEILDSIDFIKNVDIYEADYFINDQISLPAIAIQRGELLQETDQNEISSGERGAKTTVTMTLHIPPMGDNELDPVLYYFEETIFIEVMDAYLRGNPPSHLNDLVFNRGIITNLFKRADSSVFSNMSQVQFTIRFSLTEV